MAPVFPKHCVFHGENASTALALSISGSSDEIVHTGAMDHHMLPSLGLVKWPHMPGAGITITSGVPKRKHIHDRTVVESPSVSRHVPSVIPRLVCTIYSWPIKQDRGHSSGKSKIL